MTQLYLIRHGRTAWNNEDRLQGWADEPLDAVGQTQARALAAALHAVHFDAIYSSPLDRAMQTAGALAGPHGLEVVPDDRLLEWSFWMRWAGTPWADLPTREPEVAAYEHDPEGVHPEDPLSEVGRTVLAWAREAAEKHEGLVLGVSHEAPLAAAYVLGRGGDFSAFRAVHVPLLGSVRLDPGPPELVDPLSLVRC